MSSSGSHGDENIDEAETAGNSTGEDVGVASGGMALEAQAERADRAARRFSDGADQASSKLEARSTESKGIGDEDGERARGPSAVPVSVDHRALVSPDSRPERRDHILSTSHRELDTLAHAGPSTVVYPAAPNMGQQELAPSGFHDQSGQSTHLFTPDRRLRGGRGMRGSESAMRFDVGSGGQGGNAGDFQTSPFHQQDLLRGRDAHERVDRQPQAQRGNVLNYEECPNRYGERFKYFPCDCLACLQRNRSIHIVVHERPDGSNDRDTQARVKHGLQSRFGLVEGVYPSTSLQAMTVR